MTRIIHEFWHSHGHVNPGSTWVKPGLNPGSPPCLRAGFRPGFATCLRHNRIVSVKKWRKKVERGLSTRRGCLYRYRARSTENKSSQKRYKSIADQMRRSGDGRESDEESELPADFLSHTIDKRPKQRKNAIIAVAAIIIAVAYQLFVNILYPGCDIKNHKNATARVNVTGSIRVKPLFKPRFEPGSRCSCERGINA